MQPQGLGDGQKLKHGRNKLSGLVSAEGATHVSISFPGPPWSALQAPSATLEFISSPSPFWPPPSLASGARTSDCLKSPPRPPAAPEPHLHLFVPCPTQ